MSGAPRKSRLVAGPTIGHRCLAAAGYSPSKQPIPTLHDHEVSTVPTVNPYLVFDGDYEEAFESYR